MSIRRRTFLKQSLAAGALAGGIWKTGPLGAEDKPAAEPDDLVRFSPDIEPIVRRIETTPREKCLDMAADLLKAGLPYRQFLAALYLAGLRNVNPQPPGFKFHCVFVIHSAHLMAMEGPRRQQLLPLLWALDEFKDSQGKDVSEGDFQMQALRGDVPTGQKAWDELHAAMEAWDAERADRAVAGLVRSRGAMEVIEGFWKYGARDFRNIGHKAIFVAQTWRTLNTIGWRHAEPAFRSLVRGLMFYGPEARANLYTYQEQSYLPNVRRASESLAKLPATWAGGQANDDVTRELVKLLRGGEVDASCELALKELSAGKVQAQAVWDAVHLAGGELMMRQPGIFGIHTVTSANALRHAYEMSGETETRLVLMLQGLGWMGQFARFMAQSRGGLGDADILALQPEKIEADARGGAEQVLATLSENPGAAARQAMSYAQQHPGLETFIRLACDRLFMKATNAHDYKYAAAILEDYTLVSPQYRPQALATAVYNLRGSGHGDTPLMKQAAEIAGSLG